MPVGMLPDSASTLGKGMRDNRVGVAVPHPVLFLQHGNQVHVAGGERGTNQVLSMGNRTAVFFLDWRKIGCRSLDPVCADVPVSADRLHTVTKPPAPVNAFDLTRGCPCQTRRSKRAWPAAMPLPVRDPRRLCPNPRRPAAPPAFPAAAVFSSARNTRLNEKPLRYVFFCLQLDQKCRGWGGRIRTCALRYQKPLLYQLSYAPTARDI